MTQPAHDLALLARFNAWVNGRLYDAVATLPDDAYRAERGAFFGSIHRTLNHLLVVDRLWTGRIRGVDRGVRALDQVLYDDFASLRAAREAEDRDLIALVDGLEAAALDGDVVFTTVDPPGQKIRARAGHLLLGLFNHQTHHRGQVTALLTQQGVRYADLDVLYYLHDTGRLEMLA